MSLYSYFASKDDLVALMLNEVGEQLLVPEPLPEDWREALREIACRAFDAYLAHPWMLHAVGQGTRVGPTLLHRAEQLGTVALRLGLDPADGWTVACIVQEWTIGHALHVLKLREDWELAQHLRQANPERFHSLARISDARHPDSTRSGFERGLHIVLDGIDRVRR